MPYSVILPVVGGVLAGGGGVLLVCAAVPALRGALPVGARMLVGATLGFLVANATSLLLGAAPVLVAAALRADKDGPGARVAAGCALLGLFLGPLIVSPLGLLGGAWLGLRRALAARRPAPALVGDFSATRSSRASA